jgi:ribosomal protein S18 acetylase RimI-like enzyme
MIRTLDHRRDAEACDAIVASLPGWFGNEDGIRECRELVRTAPGLVCEVDRRVVGFLTYAARYATTVEITWIAVDADHRNAGIGSAILDELARRLATDGIRLMLVKTLSDREDPGQEYAATRAFYLAREFIPAMELDIWGPENPAQLLVRPIGAL